MLRFLAYTRVSTDEQTSTEAQLKTLYPLATQYEGTVIGVETDVITGHDNSRPGYLRVLEMARRKEIDGVLVWRYDRFGRDHTESIPAVHNLMRLGIDVISATEPRDDFMRDLFLLLANRETRVLSERVKLKQRDNASMGQWQSGPPMGYDLIDVGKGHSFKRLEPNASAPIVRKLFELAATGSHSIRALRDLANTMGLRSRQDKPVAGSLIHRILTNPAYVGDIVYAKKSWGKFEAKGQRPEAAWIKKAGAHPAIIDRETFALVGQVLQRHKTYQTLGRESKWLLTSVAFCGLCGARLYGKPNGKFWSYSCATYHNYGNCLFGIMGGPTIDKAVQAELRKLSVTPEVKAAALGAVAEAEAERLADANAQRANLIKDRVRHETKLRERAEVYLERGIGVVDPAMFADLQERENNAIRVIDRTLASIEDVQPLDIDAELAFLGQINWDDFDMQAWRDALMFFVEKVTVHKTKRGEPIKLDIVWTRNAAFIRELVVNLTAAS